MNKKIYLINPKGDRPTYFGGDVFDGYGMRPMSQMIDLSILTVAALVPDGFDVTVCDENITPIDYDTDADYVGITGKVSQWGNMRKVARKLRDRGKVVLIGGPHATLCPDVVRPHCDILFRGELEGAAFTLFADLRDGDWKSEYIGPRADLATARLPRLDLYPNDRALFGAVQTTRGCPFECEFCDVIQYQGRLQRHKPIPQVIAELDQLWDHGYQYAFIVDDNFTASRKHVKRLLVAMREWNDRRIGGKMGFSAQISIDTAKDEELLRLLNEANVVEAFIGIETPNPESLREVKKRQNLKVDLVKQVERFVEHGIKVTGGMIVGFDSDGPDIFQHQLDFAMSLPIPLFTVGPLVAPSATPLYARLKKANRLVEDESEVAGIWNTNIVPRRMTREQLLDGTRWLFDRLYSPPAFEQRLFRLADMLEQQAPFRPRQPEAAPRNSIGARLARATADLVFEGRGPLKPLPWLIRVADWLAKRFGAGRRKGRPLSRLPRPVELEALKLVRKVADLGPAEARMAGNVRRRIEGNPALAEVLPWYLVLYLRFRFSFSRGESQDPQLADQRLSA